MFTPGTLLAGKYELLEIAGQGGMATVWRARARGVGGFSRPLAIKVMLQRLCNDPHFVELFVEEARVSSRLQHPNVVQISDFGEHGGVYFLAMEWVDGLDLLDYSRSFTEQGYFMPWAALAIVAVEVLKGMHAAHQHRDESGESSPIFHRDVTPHNILLGVNGVVKLTDFGLAKATDRGTMTLPHVLKGKISYTAPEMTRGVRANARTDIFSLGVTLWEALAGRKMFDATSPLQVVKQIQAWSVPPLRDLRPDLPPELIQIVERSVARDPDQRHASAQELAAVLSSMLPPLPDMQRLGKSIADAKQRMAQNKKPENLAHLKDSLRPAAPAPAPTFRPASPDGRAARVARSPGPPPLPPSPQPPGAPPARPPQGPPPVRRSPSAPPPALTRSAPPTSVPIPSSVIPEVRISEQIPSISIVLDDFSAETSAPPAAPRVPSAPSLSLSITFEDGSPSNLPSTLPSPSPAPPAASPAPPAAQPAPAPRQTPPQAPQAAAPRPPAPGPAAPRAPTPGAPAPPAPRQPAATRATLPAVPDQPAPPPRPAVAAQPVVRQATPAPNPVTPALSAQPTPPPALSAQPTPTPALSAQPTPAAPRVAPGAAPSTAATPKTRLRPSRLEEPSQLDISIELDLSRPARPVPLNPAKPPENKDK